MTREDCIDFLKEDILFWEDIINNQALKETLKPYLTIEALDMAIDTMQKYQRIQVILNNAKDSDSVIRFNWLYEQIREVIDNGNDE
jgi:phosphotransferase system IIB component